MRRPARTPTTSFLQFVNLSPKRFHYTVGMCAAGSGDGRGHLRLKRPVARRLNSSPKPRTLLDDALGAGPVFIPSVARDTEVPMKVVGKDDKRDLNAEVVCMAFRLAE